jgi:hypothetical protein
VRVSYLLPSNGRYVHSHYLARGLHATVLLIDENKIALILRIKEIENIVLYKCMILRRGVNIFAMAVP